MPPCTSATAVAWRHEGHDRYLRPRLHSLCRSLWLGLSSEMPVVIVNSQRVGPVSGITGAPGQGEFYLSRYLTHGGNYETIVLGAQLRARGLSPDSAGLLPVRTLPHAGYCAGRPDGDRWLGNAGAP